MKSSLIALGSNLLVNLKICKAIRCITIFGNNFIKQINIFKLGLNQKCKFCVINNYPNV